jgi:hypothetical protein
VDWADLVVAALLAGVGGLAFILVRGTVGGIFMDIRFGLLRILMIVGSMQVTRHARARRFGLNRAVVPSPVSPGNCFLALSYRLPVLGSDDRWVRSIHWVSGLPRQIPWTFFF